MPKRDGSIAGLILASGQSLRFGTENKLCQMIDGVPVIRRVALAFLGAGLDLVTIVVGHEAREVAGVLTELPVALLLNPEYEAGQSRALVRGVAALPDGAGAAVIGVGDQPLLRPEVIRRIIARHRATGAPIVQPVYAGRPGNPVLFRRDLWPELVAVTGDVGGRPVIERHRSEVDWVEVADVRAAADVDTPEALAYVRGLEVRR